ncbi:hypothetical protein DEFDS_0836 [Deferribacter desulfuricans SSM1]|uniref:Lipoprotein n=1 Tax=Deferribacter desulfuricans (strain DSM 14783 / JCM 11476 / NBRC 101012 / SSM1) TaxID=639282 RepID=D3PCI9_DEFDS|nr:hypothetical protein [Deferribacter desulfuricans]BAI80312.1 hypothetical protein DEFDS_0836 [Deferribacter desulfuricans SSM1]
MPKDIIKKFVFLIFLILMMFGCASKSTRNLPFTQIKPLELNVPLDNTTPFVNKIDFNTNDVTIDYFDGLLQVKQPANFGPSEEFKSLIKNIALFQTKIGFLEELNNAGYKIINPQSLQHINCYYVLSGKLRKITINIYGNGFRGFGSAGNYWESYTEFDNLSIEDKCNKKIYNVGKIKSYAKVKNAPIKVSENFLDFLDFMTKVVTGVYKMYNTLPNNLNFNNIENPIKALNSLNVFFENYSEYYKLNLSEKINSPPYLGGKLATQLLFKKLITTKNN